MAWPGFDTELALPKFHDFGTVISGGFEQHFSLV
jgi:hypothetical protein